VSLFLCDGQQLCNIVVAEAGPESHRARLGAVGTRNRRGHDFFNTEPKSLIDDGLEGQTGAGGSPLGFGCYIRIKRQGGSHKDIMMLFSEISRKHDRLQAPLLYSPRSTLIQNK
jgi:hypothetical protein